MTLIVEVNGTSIDDAIPPSSVGSQMRADDGDVGFAGFAIDDPGATITTTGHHFVTVEESACSQPRLFTGYLTERTLSRSLERGMIAGDLARAHEATAVDVNAVFSFRILRGSQAKRPRESMEDRITWLLGTSFLGPFIDDTGYVSMYPALMMDEADYTGGTPAAVLDDLVERKSDTPMTYFAFWDPDAEAVGLFFGSESAGIGESDLAISNDLDDIDGSTIFAPDAEAKLSRTPEEVYSEVIIEYADGQKRLYRNRPATAEAFGIERGTTVQRPYTQSATTAQNQADRWLTRHSVERDEITVAIIVPPESAGLAIAGQRINVKFTHLPGYEDWTSMRIVTHTITPLNDVGNQYRVELVLRMPIAAIVGDCECDAEGGISLVQSTEVGGDDIDMLNPQPITLDSAPTCGNLLLMVIYARDILANLSTRFVVVEGFTRVAESYINLGDTPRPKYISVWQRIVQIGDGTEWEAAQPADSVSDAWGGSGSIFLAEYAGARVDAGTPVAAMRENDLSPNLPSYTPAHEGTVLLLAAAHTQPSQTQTLADYSVVYDSGPAGFGNRHRMYLFGREVEASGGSYTSEMSGLTDPTTDTHLIHFALTECGVDEEEDLKQTPTSPVESTTTPTENDDADAGYSVGQIWIDTTTGSVFVLTDATPGSAVWADVTLGTSSGTPSLTLGTTNATGSAGTFVATDATIAIFDATAPSTLDYNDVAAAGVASVAARRDHVHGMPAALGGNLLISDTPSTPLVFADIIQNEDEDDFLYADL